MGTTNLFAPSYFATVCTYIFSTEDCKTGWMVLFLFIAQPAVSAWRSFKFTSFLLFLKKSVGAVLMGDTAGTSFVNPFEHGGLNLPQPGK